VILPLLDEISAIMPEQVSELSTGWTTATGAGARPAQALDSPIMASIAIVLCILEFSLRSKKLADILSIATITTEIYFLCMRSLAHVELPVEETAALVDTNGMGLVQIHVCPPCRPAEEPGP
jgi:hypothetical protein